MEKQGSPTNSKDPPGYSPNTGPQGYPPNQSPYPPNMTPVYYQASLSDSYGNPHNGAVTITSQPMVVALPQSTYNDYLAWSIVNLICFNLILGIVAVIFSCKTRDSVRRGDSALAASSSHTAFILNVVALVLGIIGHIIWIAWLIYASVTASKLYSSYSYTYG